MDFSIEEIDRIARAYEAFALQAFSEAELAPHAHRLLNRIEDGARTIAERAGESSAAVNQRIEEGRSALTAAGQTADVEAATETLVQTTGGKLSSELKSPQPMPVPSMFPIGRVWKIEQRLIKIHCREETSNAVTGTLGKDEILLTGSYTYAGPRRLQSYDHTFNTGDTDKPNKYLMGEVVRYGYHRYTATHRMFEVDGASAATAAAISDWITTTLDDIIKTAVTGGRTAVKAALASILPAGVSLDTAIPIVSKILDQMEEIVDMTAGRVLDKVEEWLTSIIGPDAFYSFTSSFSTALGSDGRAQIYDVSLKGAGQSVQPFNPASGVDHYTGTQDLEVRMPGSQPGTYIAELQVKLF